MPYNAAIALEAAVLNFILLIQWINIQLTLLSTYTTTIKSEDGLNASAEGSQE